MKTISQFLQLAKPFWCNKHQGIAWFLLCLVITFALLIIHISVWITEWNKAFYDALAEFNGEVIPELVMHYLGYIILIVSFIVCGNWLRKVLIFRWREHLTTQFQQLWLEQSKHYHLSYFQYIDNPDQRIAEDVALLAEKSIDLFKYFIMNLAKLVAFIAILWELSHIQTFNIGGETITIYGYLVWIALIYSILCTLLMHFIGHKLQPLNIERQHKEADYRATLLNIREHSTQIASYRGEQREISRLSTHFQKIKQNWQELIAREFKVEIFSASYLRLSLFIPIFATLPMYLARTMTFGDMMQARSAFSNVQDGFGWFMDYYKKLMEWAAVVERLATFQTALLSLNRFDTEHNKSSADIALRVDDLAVYTPDKKQLFANFSLNFTAYDWVLIDGQSGVGKSTLLKTLAGLWHYYSGHIDVKGSILFLPQTPYLTEGSLRAILSYPNLPIGDDNHLKIVLTQVGLSELVDQLDSIKAWQNILSGGQQQRISIARVLLVRPQILFLDEATNQLDTKSALEIISLLQRQLPSTLCLVVSHQDEVKRLMNKQIVIS
ncbi:ABC transporter ATP-binding protein/permease [Ursidibacter sp. B-7004-1]